jgi:hypothetical protein
MVGASCPALCIIGKPSISKGAPRQFDNNQTYIARVIYYILNSFFIEILIK